MSQHTTRQSPSNNVSHWWVMSYWSLATMVNNNTTTHIYIITTYVTMVSPRHRLRHSLLTLSLSPCFHWCFHWFFLLLFLPMFLRYIYFFIEILFSLTLLPLLLIRRWLIDIDLFAIVADGHYLLPLLFIYLLIIAALFSLLHCFYFHYATLLIILADIVPDHPPPLSLHLIYNSIWSESPRTLRDLEINPEGESMVKPAESLTPGLLPPPGDSPETDPESRNLDKDTFSLLFPSPSDH